MCWDSTSHPRRAANAFDMLLLRSFIFHGKALSPMTTSERKTTKLRGEDASDWKSARVLIPRDVKLEEDDIGKPVVVRCTLIVKNGNHRAKVREEGTGW